MTQSLKKLDEAENQQGKDLITGEKMTWKDILKFKIKSPQDVKRLGNEYAAEDMYEAKVIDSDKYNLLSDVEKTKYHSSLYTFYETMVMNQKN